MRKSLTVFYLLGDFMGTESSLRAYRAIIARRRVVQLRGPLIRLSTSNATATVNKNEVEMLAPDRQGLTLILSRVINTLNSTLASSNRLPPRCPCAIYWVLADTRFDTLVPMSWAFFYSCHDSLSTLVCAEVYQSSFSHTRNRSGRICSRSLLRSSAACTESVAHISTICRKVAPRLSQCGWVEEPSTARRRPPSGAA